MRSRRVVGCWWTTLVGIAWVGLMAGGGCPGLSFLQGPTGATGPQGPAGLDGVNAGGTLPGTVVTFVDVNGGASVSTGDALAVTFNVKTTAGDAIPLSSLTRFSIYVSGPADNYQRVIVPEGDLTNNATTNSDGSFTYTFASTFPTTFAAPANDSAAFGTAEGELTGMPITAGTYTVGIETGRSFTIDGLTVQDAGDATFDFAVGGATLAARQVVLEANCEKCHSQLTVHNGYRFSVTGCVLCHTKGAEDQISANPANATTGRSILLSNMIHSIHRGIDLPNVKATANGSDPYRLKIIAEGEVVKDFSDVEFPQLPAGIMTCNACHGGAAQGGQSFTNPSRAACGGCHNDIDWVAGNRLDVANASVIAGTLTSAQLTDASFRELFNSVTHTFTDSQCTLCHNSSSPSLDPALVHLHETDTTKEGKGLAIEILDVTGASGGGGTFFQAGDFPIVKFRLTDKDGNALPIDSTIDTVALVVGGPTTLYQHIIPEETTSRIRPWKGGAAKGNPAALVNNGDGTFTYTFQAAGDASGSTAWPTNYPAPRNSLSQAPAQEFPFSGGWGQLYDTGATPLDAGTYTIGAYAFRKTTTNGLTESASISTWDVRFGSAGSLTPYAGTVTDDKCNSCHGQIAFHGNSRRGVRACLLCHAPGTQDIAALAGDAPAADNLDLRVMIHKIHMGADLDVVKQGGAYDLRGDGALPLDFSKVEFPAMPGRVKNCTACHATDAWKDPPTRTNMRTWMVACTACHDAAATSIHATLNTLTGTFSESCPTCHGPGKAFDVETVHAVQ